MPPYTGDYIEHIEPGKNSLKFYSFTPRPLMRGHMYQMDDELAALLIDAHRNIGFLEGLIKYAPNKEAFAELMLLKECTYSRMIDYDSPDFKEVLTSRGTGRGNTNDESIIRLLPFLGIKGFEENRYEHDGIAEYNISAQIKAVYALDTKYLEEYKRAVSNEAKDFETYLLVLKRFVDNHYSWNYTNGISETKADQKSVTEIFDIRFIGAERTSEEVRKETKQEIVSFTKDADNVADFDKFRHDVSEELEKLLSPSITKLTALFENEKNAIGLEKGNVSITSTVRANFSLADAYDYFLLGTL